MDKQEYIEKAPMYYGLALAIAIRDATKNVSTINELDSIFDQTNYRYFQRQALVDAALTFLQSHNVIEVIPDDFGPTLYRAKSQLREWITGEAAERFDVFRKYKDYNNKLWLASAIRTVNERYEQFRLTAADFDQTANEVQWEPIPLDRSDEKLRAAIGALDNAVEEIEGDNGYAVHAPGERDYVLFNLKAVSELLKESTQIYWLQVKTFAIEPLARVVARFGTAAVGIAASAARTALIEWLKTKFTGWLG